VQKPLHQPTDKLNIDAGDQASHHSADRPSDLAADHPAHQATQQHAYQHKQHAAQRPAQKPLYQQRLKDCERHVVHDITKLRKERVGDDPHPSIIGPLTRPKRRI